MADGNSVTIESLELQVSSNAAQASDGLEKLEATLSKLKFATKGLGLGSIANQLGKISSASKGVSGSARDNLTGLAKAIKLLDGVKISSTVSKQITEISNALKGADFSSGADKMGELVSSLSPLAEMPKSNLSSYANALIKLPKALAGLDDSSISKMADKMQKLAIAVKPLGDEMQKVANGFSAFPTKIQRLIASTDKLALSNNRASTSYINLYAKLKMAVSAVRQIGSKIAGAIKETNDYIENINLFNVAKGAYATEAREYAETVGELMGIDPSEWMRNQGVFMTLATGFGVASDRAAVMSQQLTQLGYDLSSFFNISYEDAFQKLQSGISGELEPLRRLGYDLSQAKLEATALSLGIDKSVSSMTQAEKAQLRYYAIMTQVTTAHGDMARTLSAPSNQIRILQAQLTQAARAIGSIFIPALNAILPYVTAVVKVIRILAESVANLFGFELPEIDYSGVSSVVGDVSEGLDEATEAAKKLKSYMLGFDELNVINPNSGDNAALGDLGGQFDFELPTYDFIGEATQSRVNQIVEDMKEWLGITDEIDSWADLLNTKLGDILKTVGAIGLAIAAWKVTQGFIDAIATLKSLLSSPFYAITIGATLSIVGLTGAFVGMGDAVKNGLDGFNLAEIIGGSILGTTGITILGSKIAAWISKAFASSAVAKAITAAGTNLGGLTASGVGAALGAGVSGIILGIPSMIVGIYDAVTTELDWLNASLTAAGATAAGAGIGAIIGACGGPIGAGIGALIGLAVGALTDLTILIVQNWEEIKSFLAPAGKWFTEKIINPIKNVCSKISTWFDKHVIQPIVEFFSPVVEELTKGINSIKEEVLKITDGIRDAFDRILKKGREIDAKLREIFEALGGAFDKYVVNPVGEFFDGVADWVKKKIIEPVSNLFKGVGDWCQKNIVDPMWNGILWLRDKAIEIFKTIGSTVVNFVSNAFKSTINGVLWTIENTINMFIGMLNGAIGVINMIPGVMIMPLSYLSIPRLADGGFVNEGQLFIAREAGAEMVGNIGSRTAVANNDQIVAGIANGVAEANSEQNILLREQNALLRAILEKDSGVYLDGRSLTNSVEKYQRERGRVLVTGGAY